MVLLLIAFTAVRNITCGIVANNSARIRTEFFENFTISDEPFAKTLQILKACVSVNNKSAEN